jgi:hypothetical protein
MKTLYTKTSAVVLGMALLLAGCKKNDDYLYHNFSIANTTGFNASMKSRVDGETFALPNGATTGIRAKTSIPGLFDITSTQTSLRFDARELKSDQYQLYTYSADVEYRITGTGGTKAADLTYQNARGTTSQNSNVTLPVTVPLTVFNGGFVYISAQNRASSGGVTVEIYNKGTLYKSNSAYGGYAIATASGTL